MREVWPSSRWRQAPLVERAVLEFCRPRLTDRRSECPRGATAIGPANVRPQQNGLEHDLAARKNWSASDRDVLLEGLGIRSLTIRGVLVSYLRGRRQWIERGAWTPQPRRAPRSGGLTPEPFAPFDGSHPKPRPGCVSPRRGFAAQAAPAEGESAAAGRGRDPKTPRSGAGEGRAPLRGVGRDLKRPVSWSARVFVTRRVTQAGRVI